MITWAFAFKYYWYNQKMVTLNQKPESKFNLGTHPPYCFSKSSPFENILTLFKPWNNGNRDPSWGVAEIQKMSLLTTGRCSRHAAAVLSNKGVPQFWEM